MSYTGQVSVSDKTQFYLNGLQNAQNGYDAAYQKHEIAKQAHDSAHQTYDSARHTYDSALQTYDSAHQAYDSALQKNEAARQMYETSRQTHESTRQIYEKSDKEEQAADVKIATNLAIRNEARGNVEKGEAGIAQGQSKVQVAQEIREKKRAFIIGKLDEAKTLLDGKITSVSQANGMPSKNTTLIQLNAFLSENAKLKKETQSAQSLDEVTRKMTTFSRDMNTLLKQIGKI